ncbi:hypothetical protein Tco_0566559 [Tanacetum coccineum]
MLMKPQFFYDHTTKQALGFQNPFYLKKAQQLEPKLYDGNVIKNTSAIVIPDSEETLTLAKESRSKMLLKQKDPMMLEKKSTPVVTKIPTNHKHVTFCIRIALLLRNPSSDTPLHDVSKKLGTFTTTYGGGDTEMADDVALHPLHHGQSKSSCSYPLNFSCWAVVVRARPSIVHIANFLCHLVRWNSKRGPEFTWEREDQFKKKYPHLFTKTTPSSSAAS